MGNSGSTSSSTSGSQSYKKRVYFDPNSNKSSGADYFIDDNELQERMEEIIEDEKIEKVLVVKEALSSAQLTQIMLYHAFVVIETEKWWWSLEKNSEGVTVQRSKDMDYVYRYYRRTKRNSPSTVIKDDGRSSMTDLVDFLYTKNLVYKDYSLATENCKDFTKKIFDKFARKKYWNHIL